MGKLRYAVPLSFLFVSLLQAQTEADIVGIVLDGHTGQALSNVAIRLIGRTDRTQSDAAGRFTLSHISPGDYLLQASTVGYHAVNSELHLHSGETSQLQLVLTPDAFRRVDTVSVQAGSLFDPTGDDAIDRFSLTGNDIKNLGTVLADDPLRAVQAIPGVSSNDDFEARFSVRGADPNRVGIYLDDIQLHQAVHTLEGTTTSGSNSIFNANLIQGVNLYDGAAPSRFGNSSAGALDMQMRDGNRDDYSFRIVANFAYTGLMAEGPFGKFQRCSWISGFRKSYLQYLLQQTSTDPSMSFGFQDLQGRLVCKVNPQNTFSLDVMEGDTGLDLSSRRVTLGPNSLMMARQKFTIANLGWQFIAG
ncbi:MAG: TonB-dependent receptor, partial [Acidobacteriaceae bacterium]|nr:TonB-dependent receptor [Acidobacteriaceae bacterium]